MEIVKVLLTNLLGIRGYGPMICNSLKSKLKLKSVDSVGEDKFSLGRYTQLGITGSAGEDRLSWGILYSAGELCYSLFVREINHVGEINHVDEYSMNC